MQAMHGPPTQHGILARMIRFSAENRFLVVATTLLLLAVSFWSMRNIPLDALPDISDTQVIVYTKWDQSPDIVEDQVTYPIVTSLLGTPKVKAVRGLTDFGFSYVYVIFDDNTDLYWARSRVLEQLSKISSDLPPGAKVELGPDATSVGWVYQYALVDRTGRHSLDELRSVQDWFLKFALQSVPGVAEVASVGGQVRQFQINVNPDKAAALGVSINDVVAAARAASSEVGGRLVEYAGREYMVRARGYAKIPDDFASAPLKVEHGTPTRIGDVATVSLGPEMRRGLTDFDGIGDAVSGIVVMRQKENALNVISAVKERLEELKKGLPDGVEVVPVYDRSGLIKSSISTVSHKLVEEMFIVSLVILIFLWHIPSALIPIATIPVSVALAFIPMLLLGQNANLMSLAGIAISVGVLVDGAIIEVENAYKKIDIWNRSGRPGPFHEVRLSALIEVGPAVFFSLLVVAIAFVPIFTLVDQEGRLFKPLAYSKNLAMAIAAFLAITLDPAMRMIFSRPDPFSFRPRWLAKTASAVAVGTYYPEEKHPVSRVMHRLYEGPCRFVLRHAKASIAVSFLMVAATVPVFFKLGSEFMPPLNEGSILYMPSTLPGLGQTEAMRILQVQDRLIGTIPEVKLVFGKAGRAETATDPAPLSMMETLVELKPESEWREVPRWYSGWAPEWLKSVFRPFWRDRITFDDIVRELDATVRLPSIPNAWTMPIKARIDMLSTGIRTPVGLKVNGPDLTIIDEIAVEAEGLLSRVPGTRSAFAERMAMGYFLDFELKRDRLARYGLSADEANMVIMAAVGGENQAVVFDGRARYPVNVRYARDFRENPDALSRLQIPIHNGGRVTISDIADIRMSEGPAMIRNENGMLNGYVLLDFDTSKIDVGTYVKNAKALADAELELPPGYSLTWSGQFENMIRVKERLKVILPITLVLIFGLIYANTKSAVKTWMVMLAVPFSAIGAFWLLWVLGYNMSIAVWVGLIALLGLDAETGVFMLLFLDLSYYDAKANNKLRDKGELVEAVVHGAVKRVRPKAMTVLCGIVGLLPILWSLGSGADLMKRVAAPMVGGLVSSFILELLIYPPVYYLWRARGLRPTNG